MEKILRLSPFFSKKIWGYEKWNVSTHRNGNSVVVNENNKLLKDVLNKELPILIKIIQANETLSVQVHPDDEYANLYENDNGKTECWYVLDAKEDAMLVSGLKKGITKEQFKKIIDENKVEEYIEKINVKSGDMIYIPAGTVHAIQGGIKILEVQQSSDVTYRIYDWGRDREMHVQKALDVIDYEGKRKGGKIENFSKLETPYFTIEKIYVKGSYNDTVKEDFQCYTVIDGSGYITDGEEIIKLEKEETVYIPNNIKYEINGDLKLIKCYV